MKCLNLGCGTRFHPDWINLDFVSHSNEHVLKHDLRQGIPFDEATFDIVYHSHVLEHFTQAAGQTFMQECYRVLRPGGILRVVVPDLEQIVRTYLMALEQCLSRNLSWQANYDWILLELFDQVSRNHSGGEMAAYLKQADISNLDFIIQRIGTEAKYIVAMNQNPQTSSAPTLATDGWLRTIRHYLWQLRESTYRLLLGKDYASLQIGRLRQSGEIHYCMYDRYSLAKLLNEVGFIRTQQQNANQSWISNWLTFNLDTEPDGTTYKPDSLFMEAQKP